MQNDCAEATLNLCYEKFYPGQTLYFDLTVLQLPQSDLQPDLFSILGLEDEDTCLTSNSPDELQCFVTSLDKSRYYFLRSGQVGGAGHFQILRFRKDGWELYSSPRNRLTLTQGDTLTKLGKERLLGSENASARWGIQSGDYCLVVKTCTPERLERLMVYLDAFRTGTGTARQRDDAGFETAQNLSTYMNRYILVGNKRRESITPELK